MIYIIDIILKIRNIINFQMFESYNNNFQLSSTDREEVPLVKKPLETITIGNRKY